MRFSTTSNEIKVYKFPIFAFIYTDEGYKRIHQGINITPRFKLDKTFELNIELIIS